MKKLFVVLLIVIVIVALAACGRDVSSTTQGADTTAPVITTPATTTVAETTTTIPTTTTGKAPETTLPGIDILYGLEDDRSIDFTRKNMFSDSYHAVSFALWMIEFDYNVALRMEMVKSQNLIYEDLFMTELNEYGEEVQVCNPDYKWVVTIDGTPIEIERFFVIHKGSGGTVYMGLGDEFQLTPKPSRNELHAYDILLQIYSVQTGEVTYYAWFTDPHYEDLYEYSAPVCGPIVYPYEENEGASFVSGPTYGERVFDDDLKTKLFTTDLATPIVWKYDKAVTAASYFIMGANNDSSYPERMPIAWKLYGSNDGVSWDLVDTQSLEAPKQASNYSERYVALSEAVTYSYFKLEVTAPSAYQFADIVLLSKTYH